MQPPNIDFGISDSVRDSHPALVDVTPALTPVDLRVADVFTLSEWVQALRANVVGPDDGSGYWGTSQGESTVNAFDPRPRWATTVIWYSK